MGGYEKVVYNVRGEEYETFLAPAALYAHFKPDHLLVLIPETLFTRDHCVKYLDALRRRAHELGGDQLAEELASKLEREEECRVVPHPGVARPLDTGEERVYECSFNKVFNAVYAYLSDALRRHEARKVIVDITHGTNILVSALLLTASAIKWGKSSGTGLGEAGLEVRVFCAPILGRVSRGARVECQEVSESLDVAGRIVAGSVAWRLLDERILPTRAFAEMGARLGRRYRGVYGSVKSLLESSEKLLWGLRSGQAPVAAMKVGDLLRKSKEAEDRLSKLLTDVVEGQLKLECDDPPWIPVADIVVQQSSTLLKRLARRGSRPLDVIPEVMRLYREVGYYDKAISLAREWLVFLVLRSIMREDLAIRAGGDVWNTVGGALIEQYERRQRQEGRGGRETSEWANLAASLVMYKRGEVLGKLRIFRNRLMHARLSKDDNVYIRLSDGGLEVRDERRREISFIDRDVLEEIVEELEELIDELSG